MTPAKPYDPLAATNAELIEHGKRQIERRAHVRGPQEDGVTQLLNTVTFSRDEWKARALQAEDDRKVAMALIHNLITAINIREDLPGEVPMKHKYLKLARNEAKAWIEEIAERC